VSGLSRANFTWQRDEQDEKEAEFRISTDAGILILRRAGHSLKPKSFFSWESGANFTLESDEQPAKAPSSTTTTEAGISIVVSEWQPLNPSTVARDRSAGKKTDERDG
jgi:hypothetical protein